MESLKKHSPQAAEQMRAIIAKRDVGVKTQVVQTQVVPAAPAAGPDRNRFELNLTAFSIL
jgi:hypothetical protein